MALSLTCDCGARFEVEDTLAGQTVLCPDCQQSLKAPALARVPLRTSHLALASAILALVGAFTPGSLVAVVLGLLAIFHITRHRDRVTGLGFATFGIIVGGCCSILTWLALSKSELFGPGFLRERTLAAQLDTSGPLEVVQPAHGFAVTRPAERWGQAVDNQLDDPIVSTLQKDRDLLLVQPGLYAFVDVRTYNRDQFAALDQCQAIVLGEFGKPPVVNPKNPWGQQVDEDDDGFGRFLRSHVRESRELPPLGKAQGREMLVDVSGLGPPWRFLIRMYKRTPGTLYVVRGYTQMRRFRTVEEELRKALDSFRILGER
jgi:hypothetical protein